jgi:multidrug efflux pump
MLVSGMIIGTLFTLFVVPSIYMLVARKRAVTSNAEAALANVSPRQPELSAASV